MRDYILNRDENGMVRYLYGKDRKYPYVGKTKWESARWMLENDKTRELRMSEEFEGFPLTADGVYFFDGAVRTGDAAVSDGGASVPAAVSDGDGSPGHTDACGGRCGGGMIEGEGGDGVTDENRPHMTPPLPSAGDGEAAPVCGPDWCEIPEVAEKPKRKKRVKDVVYE